ncbi:fas-activated serine/threonine kinase isoform X6 [Hippopotamus amphibius kiboko]|uniref:fas-activated serine/threonine kinase isoform X6 n=1 Tax=Hippopotamus amphibius kiboko TaxID=575201 RepID=UPI002598DD5F|nr:fas-activated serine/threonine kinase isoform X6 [Hippopotamus amphibius kiboko]
MRRPRGEPGPRAPRPAEAATCAGPGEPWSPSPSSMLRVLLSAQASSARLSGLLLLPAVQPYCLGPSKWGDRHPGGRPHAGPVQGLQRLLEQARSPGELLRWLGQNPTKVRAHHYPVALRRLGQLLGSQPQPPPVEQATLQDLSQLIIRNCPSFDIHTIHVCLHLAVLLGLPPLTLSLPGFPSDGPLVCALEQERRFRLPPKPPPPLQPVLRGGQRLEAALNCPRFQRHPQQHLIRSLAEARPEELTPHVMVLLAQHLARHRLREPQLLEAIAHFLVVQEAQLNSKVVQKLVLPFGRLNYLPLEQQFMPCLERILAREAGVAPLATVNILMSLCQLRCLPFRALHFVFSPGFINHVSDTAVELELPGYRGPRLPQRQQVPIFPQPLITDRARCKYSHKDIVAEGLRQLLGEEKYRQDLTVPPGYCTDFLLCVSSSGAVLPVRTQDPFLPYPPRPCPHTTRDPVQSHFLLRVVLMLRERWHFCRDGRVLLGSRALRERHLGLMGYQLLPLPFEELESQRGLPQLKSYLRQKLQALGLRWGPEGG